MQYAKIENGQVVSTNLPSVGVLKNGCTVSGYDKLDVQTLKSEGWYPLGIDTPSYDESIQYLKFSGYDIGVDKVTMMYEVVEKPPLDLSTLKQQKIQESKVLLGVYLEEHPFLFVDGKYYTCTAEKQTLLANALTLYELESRENPEAVFEWNARGEEHRVMPIEVGAALAIGLGRHVKPFIIKQQTYEVEVNVCHTAEEVESVVLNYAD